MQHQEKNLTQVALVLATSLQYCPYTTLWNAEVVAWQFTTMNSYWIPHASAQKWLTKKRQTRFATIVGLSRKVTSVTLHPFYCSMCSKCPPPASGKRSHHSQTVTYRFNNMHFTRWCSDSIKVR